MDATKKILFIMPVAVATAALFACLTAIGYADCSNKSAAAVCPKAAPCADTAYTIPAKDILVRDPFVFADKKNGRYYIQGNKKITSANPKKEDVLGSSANSGLYCYESADLKNWRYVGQSFKAPADFWGKSDFWAPDMFGLDGKYYIIATFSCAKPVENLGSPNPKMLHLRACAALVSDKPEGPYKPVSDKPLTPENWMCLDGTLFQEDGKLWLIYCHEWVQVGDGEIVAQEVSRDLTKTVGKPIVLFKASEAKWCQKMGNGGRVTDAGVVNRAEDGTLFMTWSSFGKCTDGKTRYVIGLAVSENGKLIGKWRQLDTPLNSDDGGHAMIFKTFCGKTKISYHAPNSYPEHTIIRDFQFKDGKAELGSPQF